MYRVALVVTAMISTGRLRAQPPAAPAFEAASIRLTRPGDAGSTSFSPVATNRWTATNAPLFFLVQIAYGISSPDQISGAEKLGSQRFDLTAKADDGVILTAEELRPRLRRLLEDRFKLAAHHEQREVDGFALVVAKGGPKLKPASGEPEPSGRAGIYPGGLHIMNANLSWFATNLKSPAGRPVVDKTGIEGNYDFEMRYSLEDDRSTALPSFFTALQEQFGLKLDKSKVTIDVVVIDHAEKMPTAN